jgi:IclR family transcriptional regulator, acetate operon repressor
MTEAVAGADAGALAADRAARLLAIVLDRSPWTPHDLAEALDAQPAAVGSLLNALERHGLITADAELGSVRPGPTALRFARSGIGQANLVELAHPSLRRLADETGETANLIVPRPDGNESVQQIDGSHLLGVTNWIGRPLANHCTAAGKVFLAFGAAELPAGGLERLTPETITDPERLRAELETVREQEYATIVDELETGLSAVAAPIRDSAGTVVAALSVSGASLRLAPQRLALIGRVAHEQAADVSARLGFEAPPGGARGPGSLS